MADALKGAFFDMLEDQYDIEVADKAYQTISTIPKPFRMRR